MTEANSGKLKKKKNHYILLPLLDVKHGLLLTLRMSKTQKQLKFIQERTTWVPLIMNKKKK